MLPLFFWLALSTSAKGIISIALDNFNNVETYAVTLDSTSGARREVVKYFYKKPGYVRMNFVEPRGGAVLVYDPVRKEARLQPPGALKSFVVTLSQDNKLITGSKGRAIAESDIGALLRNAERLQAHGTIEVLSEEKTGDRDTVKVKILGGYGYSVADVNAYVLWLDKRSFLPVRAAAYDAKESLAEDVVMDDLVINPVLPDNLFKLE